MRRRSTITRRWRPQPVSINGAQELIDRDGAGTMAVPGPGPVKGRAGREPEAAEDGPQHSNGEVDDDAPAAVSRGVEVGRIEKGHGALWSLIKLDSRRREVQRLRLGVVVQI